MAQPQARGSRRRGTGARFTWRLLLPTLCVAAVLVAVLLPAPPAQTAPPAGIFNVNSTVDAPDLSPGDGTCASTALGNPCTLRAAIMEANAFTGADTINVPAGTYTLTIVGPGEDGGLTGDLDITEDVTINGAGVASTIIEAGGGFGDRIFEVRVGTTSMSGVTIRQGNVAGSGGGINVIAGAGLILSSATVGNNVATGSGGGINGGGHLSLNSVTISSNIAASQGGGLFVGGAGSTITSVTISGNSVNSTGNGQGGGFFINASTTMTSVTVSGNTATGGISFRGQGGGGFNNDVLTLTNSTFSGNSVTGGNGGQGGGFFNNDTVSMSNVVFDTNQVGPSGLGIDEGGGYFELGDGTLDNVIVRGRWEIAMRLCGHRVVRHRAAGAGA
jgi:CSLREA domain-containing protein